MALLSTRLRAQIIKELLCVWRDPKSRFMLIGPPLMQLLVFSFAATLEIRNVDLTILNRDTGRWGDELVARVDAAGFTGHITPVSSQKAIEANVDRRRSIAALDIPEALSRDIAAGRDARVQVILDGRRANASQILLGYLNQIISDLQAELSGAGSADPVAVRHWFNENLVYRWFIVPGLGGILVMFATLLITALSIARERELGTFDQLLVSPCTPSEIIIAKIVPALLIGSILGILMAAAAVLGFGVPFVGSYAMLFGCLELFILSIVGIGLMISSICTTQQQAILGTFAIAVPAVLVSGFATPIENMPKILQWLAEAIPLKHYLLILHGSFLKGLSPSQIAHHAWPMAVIAILTLSTATLVVRGRLQ
ncbi:MAG: ABC transporter permease [Methylotetracoccus sp.]